MHFILSKNVSKTIIFFLITEKHSVETQSLLPSNFAVVGTTTDKNSLENKDFRINIVNYFYINIRQILKMFFFCTEETPLIYGFDDVESVKKCIQRKR